MAIKLSERSKVIPKSGIRKIFDIARKYEDVISFTIGEPDFQTPDHIKEAAFEAIKEGYTHYTPNAGLEDFREAAAKKLKRENRLEVDPATEIIATPGAMGGLSLAVYATIDEGDEVLITDPEYVSYFSHILMAGGRSVRAPVYEQNNFILSAEDVKKRITRKTRAIILNYPDNPTGSTLLEKDLKAICEVVRENDLTVISDEVYERITYGGVSHRSIASLPDMKDRVISIFSLSKTYAMTGWRIGYAVGNEDVIKEMTKLQEHVSIHPSAVSQKAAIAALSGPQDAVKKMVEEYDRRREKMYREINEISGISCIKPLGAFYIFANVKDLGMTSYDTAIFFLEKSRVATVPGSEFGPSGEGYIRISYSTSQDQIEKGIGRMADGVGKMKHSR